MIPFFVAFALAGPLAPAPEETHLRRCESRQAAFAELAAADLSVPVGAPEHRRVVDSFHSPRSGGRIHKATDIMAPRGTPIFALDDGVISQLRWNRLGGRVIEQLDETGCVGFYYAHLDDYAPGLQAGAAVRRGDLLGFVGTTGNAGGAAHLHLGVYYLGFRPGVFSWTEPLNPFALLFPRDES
jgi:murein DD-endopeptidase MepM/ murein hydrolase activator NlpD